MSEAARRKIAAPQLVILKERPPLPRMKDLNRRSPRRHPSPCPSIRITKHLCHHIPVESQIGGGFASPITGSPDDQITRSWHPLPPGLIPDWRRLQKGHAKSSQIGVGFSDYPSIGVDFNDLPFRSFVSFVVQGFWGFLGWLLSANCWLLIFKDRPTHYFFALERISHFTILFALLSSKKHSAAFKKAAVSTGWNRACPERLSNAKESNGHFMPAVRS